MESGMALESVATDIWQNDLIGRKEEAEFIKSYVLAKLGQRTITGQPRSFVLNIDAPWGSGKTQFLESFEKQLKIEGYLVARVNAWVDDHSDDPLTSVLAAIDNVVGRTPQSEQTSSKLKAIKRNAGRIVVTAARGFGKSIAKKYIGDAVGDIAELVSESVQRNSTPQESPLGDAFEAAGAEATNEALDVIADRLLVNFKEEKRALNSFRSGFEKLLDELGKANPKHANMFILVDELDRCRPDYAIRMLERIKHLFSTSGAVFVVATDTAQLHHAVRAVYGQGFDSERYLLRFFDRQYHFRPQSRLKFTTDRLTKLTNKEKLNLPADEDLAEYFDLCASGFELSLRDAEQVVEMLADSLLTWSHVAKIEALYLIPLLMMVKKDKAKFARFGAESQTNEDVGALSALLNFKLRTQHSSNTQVTGWTAFSALWGRRRWKYNNVILAMNAQSPIDRMERIANDAVYGELRERIRNGARPELATTLLSTYLQMVDSIVALSE